MGVLEYTEMFKMTFTTFINSFVKPLMLRFPQYSDAVDSVTGLYNHVEEQAHVLVQRSNVSLEHLEYLLQLREMEGHFTQVRWLMFCLLRLKVSYLKRYF